MTNPHLKGLLFDRWHSIPKLNLKSFGLHPGKPFSPLWILGYAMNGSPGMMSIHIWKISGWFTYKSPMTRKEHDPKHPPPGNYVQLGNDTNLQGCIFPDPVVETTQLVRFLNCPFLFQEHRHRHLRERWKEFFGQVKLQARNYQ